MAKQQGGSRHCSQGHHPTRGRIPRGMLRLFVHPCPPAAAGEIGRSTDAKRSWGCQSRRQTGILRKEESQARVEAQRPMGTEESLLSLFGERLNSRDGVLLPRNATLHNANSTRVCTAGTIATAVDEPMLFSRLRAAAAAGDARQRLLPYLAVSAQKCRLLAALR